MKDKYRIYFTKNGVEELRYIISENYNTHAIVRWKNGQNILLSSYDSVQIALEDIKFGMEDYVFKGVYDSFRIEEIKQ
jgi:hypothetical protein